MYKGDAYRSEHTVRFLVIGWAAFDFSSDLLETFEGLEAT